MTRAQWVSKHPEFPWLSVEDADGVEAFLRNRGWLERDERVVGVDKAGEGNMNLTLRVTTDRRSIIVKQARPWVEKYDVIAAPWDRVVYEQRFYAWVSAVPAVVERMPRLLASDIDAKALVLEDLAPARDLSDVYTGGVLSGEDLRQLAIYAAALHAGTRGAVGEAFANREMRALNHQHIYDIPLRADNGVNLERYEPGLTRAARELAADADFVQAVRQTGERYLADGECLLHGDFFPGSWLETAAGVFVIDPEFCYAGDAEFDLGVAAAHLALAAQPKASLRTLLDVYEDCADRTPDDRLIARYAACEVVRRLIGVAQLPLPPSDGRRAQLLHRSQKVMEELSLEPLWDGV